MDPQPQQIILPQPPEQKRKLKSLLFLEAGIFEFGFVLLLLGLVFGILNYFNILKLSTVIPFLSFLPHQKKVEQLQTTTTTILPTSAPTGPFTYDATSEYILLETYTKKTLTDEYLPQPATSSAQPVSASSSASSFIFLQDKNVFTSPWTIKSSDSALISATATVSVKERTNIPNMYKVWIRSFRPPLAIYTSTPIAQASQSVVSKVFRSKLSTQTWQCSTTNGEATCTLKQGTSDGQITYVITLEPDTSKTIISSVKSCFVPTEALEDIKNLPCN